MDRGRQFAFGGVDHDWGVLLLSEQEGCQDGEEDEGENSERSER